MLFRHNQCRSCEIGQQAYMPPPSVPLDQCRPSAALLIRGMCTRIHGSSGSTRLSHTHAGAEHDIHGLVWCESFREEPVLAECSAQAADKGPSGQVSANMGVTAPYFVHAINLGGLEESSGIQNLNSRSYGHWFRLHQGGQSGVQE